jgi:hypothetical protein
MTACGAPTLAGGSCPTTNGLCAECGLCLSHCEHRREQVAASRLKGNQSDKRQPQKFRTVAADLVPSLETMDDAVKAAAWLFQSTCDGTIDPTTSREGCRAITVFKDAVNKRDLLRRIKELEQIVTHQEKALKAVENRK